MFGPAGSMSGFIDRVFRIQDPDDLNALALDLFHLHAQKDPIYREFIGSLRGGVPAVGRVEEIPYLPIGVFRNHRVLLEGLEASHIFTSSGTTGQTTSSHHVPWPMVYERSFITSFTNTYGPPGEWRILALLPAYLERTGSSLVHMAEKLIRMSGDPLSGTYLHDHDRLMEVIRRSESEGRRTLLLGVTFALLDLAERHPFPLEHTIIMETGGMKGRRREMVREEVHSRLKEAFGVPTVHSEYGMTELLSQAWSTGNGVYRCPPWMRVRIREVNDPFAEVPDGRTGGIDVIDLANVASCPFISTQDLGRRHADGSFEVLGRFDHSDVRGCNLMVE